MNESIAKAMSYLHICKYVVLFLYILKTLDFWKNHNKVIAKLNKIICLMSVKQIKICSHIKSPFPVSTNRDLYV